MCIYKGCLDDSVPAAVFCHPSPVKWLLEKAVSIKPPLVIPVFSKSKFWISCENLVSKLKSSKHARKHNVIYDRKNRLAVV